MANNLLLRQKYHQYFVYTSSGVYLGLLQNVTSTFQLNQLIATSFAQLPITVGQSADVADQANEAITDEQGNPITDEAGNAVLIERQPDVVGSNNSKALIANNNIIKVYEYSNYYPNGTLKFSGYISKWKATFGASNDILVTCLSNGQDLSNYLVSSGDTAFISQTTDNSTTINVGHNVFIKALSFTSDSQTFTVPSNILIGGISIEVTAPEAGTWTISVKQMVGTQPDPANDPLLVTGTLHTGIISVKTVQKITFSTFPSLNTGLTYYYQTFWTPDSGSTATALIYGNTTNPYANGSQWSTNWDGLSYSVINDNSGTVDQYFIIWQHGGNITGGYILQDPSFILNDIMTSYASSGGLIGVPAAGYTNTGTLATYTFKMQTILQAIQAVLALAPSTWYWYVDPATNLLQFAQASTTADITIIRKRHIDELEIEATKENIKNNAYFTGGDDGTGQNLNILVSQQVALSGNRVGLALLTDNRVNSNTGSTTTAKLIASNYLNVNSAEQYITNVTIQDQTMDINLLRLGMMVGFSGFGNFVDNLLLQIVGINYLSDQAVLQLGTLPKRDTAVVAAIQAGLQYTQTVANPPTPS